MIAHLLASADCFATQYGTQCEEGEATPGSLLAGLLIGAVFFGYLIYAVRRDGTHRPGATPPASATPQGAATPSPTAVRRTRPVQRRWIAWSAGVLFVLYSAGVFMAVGGQPLHLSVPAYTEQGRSVSVSVDCGSSLFGNYPTDDEIDRRVSAALTLSGLPQDTRLSLKPSGRWDVFLDVRQQISASCAGARDDQKTASAPKLIALLALGCVGLIGLMFLAHRAASGTA